MDSIDLQNDYKIVEKKDIVVTVSYLLGQKDEIYETYYADYLDLVNKLKNNDSAKIIRFLCKMRTTFMQKFKKIANARRELIPLDKMEWFDADEIAELKSLGVDVVLANKDAEDHVVHINRLIDKNIDNCKCLFPDWVNFSYIRDLFVMKGYEKHEVQISEFTKYQANRYMYPFQFYIHWNPESVGNVGNILMADGKFLRFLYSIHGEEFTDSSKYHDATESTKKSIYDFVNDAQSVIIVVDCENCDPYKLYGALCNLDSDQISKINRIVLYDDAHTTRAWDYISCTTHINVEHIEVSRVLDGKSLVDIRMTAGICKAHYEEGIDSFILCSSDSDFWGVIEALDKADFLVMYEYEKCSRSIKEALDGKQIFHCSLDDFFTGNSQKLQTVVLKKILSESLPDIIGRNAWDLTEDIYRKAWIEASRSDMQPFYDKYVKTISLKINQNDEFEFRMAD